MNHPGHGSSIHENVFAPGMMREVLGVPQRAELARTRAGARHVLAVPSGRALAPEPAMLQIARELSRNCYAVE